MHVYEHVCVLQQIQKGIHLLNIAKITKSRPQPRDAVLIKYEKIYDIKNTYYFIEQMHKY